MSEFTAYYCNQYLTEELNGRIERRLRGTETLEPFLKRSVSTRLETMPLYDCRKKSNTISEI